MVRELAGWLTPKHLAGDVFDDVVVPAYCVTVTLTTYLSVDARALSTGQSKRSLANTVRTTCLTWTTAFYV
jgi:hypothetical protein